MTNLSSEQKQAKLIELANLSYQYEQGEKSNIKTEDYPKWVLISEMLKNSEIDESIYDDFLVNPTHYKTVDGYIIYNENWEDDAKKAEAERIAKLHITKYDFFKYICKPNGIGYEQLMQLINSDEDLAAAWNLCSYVYRGDQTLNDYIFKNVENITEEELTRIFEEYAVN